jgi:LSD1 subclass zinc finger protein
VADHGSYKCGTCGAPQTLAPGAEALACAHCGAVTPIAPVPRAIVEHDFETARARVQRGPAGGLATGAREVQCKTCGARSVTTLQARRCPFCDEPLVVEIPPTADTILPDAVLPFAITKDDAAAAYQGWLRSRWFAPNDLRRRAERDGLDGVYAPYWHFDSDSLTRYTGSRGEHYWDEETYRDSQGKRQTRRVRKTRWYPASGTVQVRFDDVAVCASSGLPRQRMAALEPWKLDGLRPFDGAYLAGFIAERYSIDLEDGWTHAQEIMEGRIATAVRRDIGGDEQRIHSMDVHHRGVRYKHVLLPVWVSSYRYRGKVYRVVVNAQTREVAGDRPWSVWKIALAVAVAAAVIAAIVYLISQRRPPPPPPPSPDQVELPAQGPSPR